MLFCVFCNDLRSYDNAEEKFVAIRDTWWNIRLYENNVHTCMCVSLRGQPFEYVDFNRDKMANLINIKLGFYRTLS